MIIWSGRGWIAAVTTFGVCLMTNYYVDARWGQDYYSDHLWIVGLAVLGGGLLSAAIGFGLKPLTERELIDPKTDERVVIQSADDTLFFIPLHWAGCVIATIGVITIVYDFLKLLLPRSATCSRVKVTRSHPGFRSLPRPRKSVT